MINNFLGIFILSVFCPYLSQRDRLRPCLLPKTYLKIFSLMPMGTTLAYVT
jgi:hypothetical protein